MLLSSDGISHINAKLGREISKDYKEKTPLLIGVLSGAVLFLADLMRYIEVDMEIDFVRVKTYEDNKKMAMADIIHEPVTSVVGRDIIIVEDIVDSGDTIEFLKRHFELEGAKSIKIASMFKRASCKVKVDYLGFEIGNDKFLVGYGLDDNQLKRNLPHVYELK